jgi:glyoxylase-like metal-dependent hydrolase (beta-lactamase superfamily II)
MLKTRSLLAALFIVLAAVPFWISLGEAQPGIVKKVADGVWFREGERDQGHCNNIIIEMKDYLIVVDANFPSGAKAVLEDLKKISPKRVKYVFDTHHHGDHAYGNPVWTQYGATTLAYIGVVEELKRYEPQRWQEAAKTRDGIASLKLDLPEAPKETFSKSPHVIEDESRTVEFHFFGWAHTRGDGFVYLPKEKILCTGDAITNGPFNYTGDGYIGNWPSVVAKAKKLDVEVVLPGHGGLGGPELLDGEERFMTELHAAVKKEVDRGRKIEDFVRFGGDKEPQSTTIELSDAVRNWVGERFPLQVRDAYEEITQGKPHGEILGGT